MSSKQEWNVLKYKAGKFSQYVTLLDNFKLGLKDVSKKTLRDNKLIIICHKEPQKNIYIRYCKRQYKPKLQYLDLGSTNNTRYLAELQEIDRNFVAEVLSL